VDRIRPGLLRRADVLFGGEVARDLDEPIGRPGVECPGVVRRCDRDRLDPELAAGPKDAHRDLASVGHEQ
jgi:hypothetical protein